MSAKSVCSIFAAEIKEDPLSPSETRKRDAFVKLKFQSAQPMPSHRPPLWGGLGAPR